MNTLLRDVRRCGMLPLLPLLSTLAGTPACCIASPVRFRSLPFCVTWCRFSNDSFFCFISGGRRSSLLFLLAHWHRARRVAAGIAAVTCRLGPCEKRAEEPLYRTQVTRRPMMSVIWGRERGCTAVYAAPRVSLSVTDASSFLFLCPLSGGIFSHLSIMPCRHNWCFTQKPCRNYAPISAAVSSGTLQHERLDEEGKGFRSLYSVLQCFVI